MTTPNLQTKTFVIPANNSVPFDITGSTINNISSTAGLFIQIGSGNKSRFDEGDEYQLEEGLFFDQITLINETGGTVTVTVAHGTGKVRTANTTTISGTVKVDDDATQSILTTIDADTGGIKTDTAAISVDTGGIKTDTAAISVDTGGIKTDTAAISVDTGGIKTDIAAIKTDTASIITNTANIADIEALLTNDKNMRASLTTLAGASFSLANNATVTPVTGAANVNGVIIRTAALNSSSGTGSLQIGGNKIAEVRTGTSVFFNNLFVPSGNEIKLVSTSASVTVSLYYEVL